VTSEELMKMGAVALHTKLEELCVSLEKAQDSVSVCAMALEGPEPADPAISKVLRHAVFHPLGDHLCALSRIIVQLKGELETD